ncbi:RNA-binding cell elongation regulator Jag/EloR [Streptococcus ferus]|uniref:RNA-binding protein KhpB n=1 Tax=Streptococcus ferus TaxID=1345 RepID=A0A2X3W6F8_9STRE|nr:RNA-binding cell elongation regulator Jag/EloR [Streptococcus ferus]SQF41107.1 RNA-binding protein [Streptococcus ferus]
MVLFTGKTVEEAIEEGLRQLGISRMQAHIRVISREKKGFLGFGKKPAQVEVENIDEKTAHQADQKAVRGVPDHINQQNEPVSSKEEDAVELSKQGKIQAEQAETPVTETEKVSAADQANDSFEDFVASEFNQTDDVEAIEEASKEVADYIQKIIYEMDLEASIDISHNRRHINLQIETQEPGRVIGYHGKVLKSLQLLAQNFLHDRYTKHYSITLNVHDYMEHRAEILIDFTKKTAQRVLESGQSYEMDPMSNIERKIVHKTIATIDGVESYSEGDDPNRYVVVVARD